jgi:hypothetical protein
LILNVNARTCAFKVSDPWGLGRERKYYDDDMDKQMRAKFIPEKKKENEWFKNFQNAVLQKKIYLIIQLMVKNKIIQDILFQGWRFITWWRSIKKSQ